MNANPKFLASTAQVDEAAVQPMPASRKVYVTGTRPDLRVPMREITQSDTPAAGSARRRTRRFRLRHFGAVHRSGRAHRYPRRPAALREKWIAEREDTAAAGRARALSTGAAGSRTRSSPSCALT
jgi:phosphomethylpyrimidine synthase